MGRHSQRLLLLAAGLLGSAGAYTIPPCWDSCITKAVQANPGCYDIYGAGILGTSCYCGPDQGGYLTDVECCANGLCNAADFATGRLFGRSVCESLGEPDLTDGSIVCATTTIFYTGITDAGPITAATTAVAHAGSTPVLASHTLTAGPSSSAVIPEVQTAGSSTSALSAGILTADCGSPTFTSVIASATTTSFPLIGCAPNNPSCCPFNINVGGVLSACPSGYSTISNTACCPSGWSFYSSSLGNNVPCVTTPVFDLTAPNSSATGTAVVVIVDRVFALQYQLSTATTSAAAASGGLSVAAEAGIGAGVGVVALAAIIGVVFFLIRRYRRTHPAQAPALAPPENMEYIGPNELHSTSASKTVSPLSHVVKPGHMEMDGTPQETSPHHGYVEVDAAAQLAHNTPLQTGPNHGYVEADAAAQSARYELVS